MKILIVHCHFERGGVTQVVDNHVHCLQASDEIDEVALVSGPRQSGLQETTRSSASIWRIASLEYDSLRDTSLNVDEQAQNDKQAQHTAREIDERCRQAGWTRQETVVHWHNHSLGKNAASPLVIKHLADLGYSCLLQIHDFAEDQRPQNWAYLKQSYGCEQASELDAILYPHGDRLSYATLTTGDAETLVQFGIHRSRVDVLPNSVRLPTDELPEFEVATHKVRRAFNLPADFRWMLYPVRGIRRKNLGEFLLMCQLAGRPTIGAMTLMPDTPMEKKSYERWQAVAERCVENVVFNAAHHEDIQFVDNLSAASVVVSSSVAEGFGMVFLEPWLASRSVVARNLPGVTGDFINHGMRLEHLYNVVQIPGSPSWLTEANRQFQNAKTNAWKDVRRNVESAQSPSASDQSSSGANEWIDFARLTPAMQIEVLERFNTDSEFAKEVRDRNAALCDALVTDARPEIIDYNRNIVAANFGPENQKQQLLNAYRKAISNESIPGTGVQNDQTMLELVENSRPFYPCRVEQLD
ncbi:glycosyltransferase family protein [Rhodopirellula baltica]|uniref:Uncharacterized protein n=1 Tax=Rhodopirellula baltica SWK14 TaxID=993516 RepID=L7CHG7_RHOBT|nr:hypothetical protein [Rhodopirellula baltica]ELP33714.1 hypothetical protein RBSWK_02369 [Rhodopirellula baltica SWK14]